MSLVYFIKKYFSKKSKITISRVLELQILCYKFYYKIVNIFILDEFLNFLFQNLFISIDDGNWQSNRTNVN